MIHLCIFLIFIQILKDSSHCHYLGLANSVDLMNRIYLIIQLKNFPVGTSVKLSKQTQFICQRKVKVTSNKSTCCKKAFAQWFGIKVVSWKDPLSLLFCKTSSTSVSIMLWEWQTCGLRDSGWSPKKETLHIPVNSWERCQLISSDLVQIHGVNLIKAA